MSTSPDKSSARYYPWDMILLLYGGFPFSGLILCMGTLSFLSGTERTLALSGAFLLAVVGVGLLVWAKLPLYRAGNYTSFGPSAIPVTHRAYYYWGMGTVVVGGLLFMALAF